MTIEHMKGKLMFDVPKYKGPKWQTKVMNMSDAQIYALYHKFNECELFRGQKNANKFKKELKKREKDEKTFHQVTIFEYLEDLKGETNKN